MASAPSNRGPVAGRLDRNDRLVSADPELIALQSEAGSKLGGELALPQVTAVARLARKLGVPVSRPALVAGEKRDIDLWVRATPQGDEILLSLERWAERQPARARLSALVAHDQEVGLGGAPEEWATDEELRLVSLSPGLAELLGVETATAIGQKLTRLLKLEEDDQGELPLLTAAASRSSFSGQRGRARNGDERIIILNGRAVGGGDRFAGFEGEAVAEDQPTEGAPEPASALDAVLDEALRTPLDQIIDAADRIVQQSDGPLRSDYAEYAGDIAIAARHLLSVIRSMGGDSAADDRIDLAELAADASAMLEAAAEQRSIILALEPSPPVTAHGEARGVIQILVNLIGNAVRHSPEGGTVAISFDSDESQVRVHVADQGKGIALADQQRIFERFERADPSEGGSGLGLAISRRLARSMDGDVHLESRPGEGARFTLQLPKA